MYKLISLIYTSSPTVYSNNLTITNKIKEKSNYMKIIYPNLKSIIYIWIFFAILPILSCSKPLNNPIQHFSSDQREMLTHSRIIDLEEFNILKPGAVIRKDDSYMFWDINNEKTFHFVNFDSKRVIKGVKKGSGPGEIIYPSSYQLIQDKFYVFDPDNKKISQIDVSSDTTLILKEIEKVNFDKKLFLINYQKSNMIATGLFEDAWLATLTTNGKIISKINFPDFEETSDTPKMALSFLYLITHTSNKPDNKKVVAVTQDLGVISFFDYINGEILKEYKQIKYFAPNFILRENGGISYSKDGLIGFCGVDCDDKYVYILYSGRTYAEHELKSHYCENLFIYDWDGNPIKHYILDIPLISMKYDKAKNSIYGIGYHPEGAFVEYQL